MEKTFKEYEMRIKDLMNDGYGRVRIMDTLDLTRTQVEKWMKIVKDNYNITTVSEKNVQEFEDNKEEVIQCLINGKSVREISKLFDITRSRASRWIKKIKEGMTENELDAFTETVSLSKTKQRLMDKNRIREKVLRESFRVENAVEEYNKSILDVFKKHNLSPLTISHNNNDNTAAGIIHVSDVHFNELIDIENVNKYDFRIASKRFKLLANQAKKYFAMFGISNILIAMTGDMLNSDRRLDELLSMSTNRSNASFLAVDILQQFILDLNQKFNINIAYVTGNESRVPNEVSWSKAAITDNYDTTIFNILKYIFKDSKGINFIEGDPCEMVVKVAGLNILMIHGHGSIRKDVEKSVEQIKGRYSARGQKIDYVIFGHLHSARIGDVYSRCASLAGANAYSENNLNLTGRASQNLYIVHDNGLLDGIKVDLQITKGDQYSIDESLEAYNCKSSGKGNKKTPIFEVVI